AGRAGGAGAGEEGAQAHRRAAGNAVADRGQAGAAASDGQETGRAPQSGLTRGHHGAAELRDVITPCRWPAAEGSPRNRNRNSPIHASEICGAGRGGRLRLSLRRFPAAAQSWPARPLTMVVPFAPGGGTDVLGRIVGRRLSEVLGQQVIIENVGGAGGMVGSARVAKAAP